MRDRDQNPCNCIPMTSLEKLSLLIAEAERRRREAESPPLTEPPECPVPNSSALVSSA
jgi:hypothetical protein